ncbi:SDR family oxidoreductase [Streptomyces sp. or43]|nr:SDR family oxidoreductase [Streptomyces sp. or43]
MGMLDGEIAVITGGSTGLALAGAKLFVGEGAHVFIQARRQESLDEAVALIGRDVTAVQGDASDLDDLDHLYDLDLRVNVLTAGQVGTAKQEELFDETTRTAFESLIPRGRLGRPEEIAAIARFLASGDSSYVNGLDLAAAGGTTAIRTRHERDRVMHERDRTTRERDRAAPQEQVPPRTGREHSS